MCLSGVIRIGSRFIEGFRCDRIVNGALAFLYNIALVVVIEYRLGYGMDDM